MFRNPGAMLAYAAAVARGLNKYYSIFLVQRLPLLRLTLLITGRGPRGCTRMRAFLLMLSAAVYFLFNTLPVATIIALTENKKLQKIWTDCYFWSLPYYLAGGALDGHVRMAYAKSWLATDAAGFARACL